MNSPKSNQTLLAELPKTSLILRFAAIGAVLAGIAERPSAILLIRLQLAL